MKGKQLIWAGILVTVILASIMLSTFGCSNPSSPSTAASGSASTTAPPSSAAPSSSAAAARTLKVGVVFNQGSDIGVDSINGIKLLAEADNAKGGIKIGNDMYKIEIITYDNEDNQTKEVAAINRLIYEDKVQYILANGIYDGAWLSETEKNKVIAFTMDPNAMVSLAPNLHYTFGTSFQNPSICSIIGWFCKNYPAAANNMLCAYPDSQFGHLVGMLTPRFYKIFTGIDPQIEYYPSNAQDLSSLGTKVVTKNPGGFMCMSGTAITDGLVFNAVYQAGYRGQIFTATEESIETWSQALPLTALDGFICGAYPSEFNKPVSQDFVNLWVNKYGKWSNPRIASTPLYPCLTTALGKAGTTDTDKVAEVISSGLEYSTPIGNGKMIARPDLNNPRTVDSICEYYVKQIKDGKANLLATISIEEGLEYFNKSNAAPMAMPPK
jgi:branched-chain amino acid transport system substrate-binding protein